MQIKDSVFLVTGGSSGLGAATVRMVHAAGGKAVIADVNQAPGEALASELGDNTRFVYTDVTDEASAKAAVDATLREFGGLHGLANCAGVAPAEKVIGRESPPKLDGFVKTVLLLLDLFHRSRY